MRVVQMMVGYAYELRENDRVLFDTILKDHPIQIHKVVEVNRSKEETESRVDILFDHMPGYIQFGCNEEVLILSGG